MDEQPPLYVYAPLDGSIIAVEVVLVFDGPDVVIPGWSAACKLVLEPIFEWSDIDLDAGTVRFRRALTIVDPAVHPDHVDPGSRRKEVAVGLVKSAASSAILTLP
jgi:hypothetical protein